MSLTNEDVNEIMMTPRKEDVPSYTEDTTGEFEKVVHLDDGQFLFQAIGIGKVEFHCRLCGEKIPPGGYMRTFQWGGEDVCRMCGPCDSKEKHGGGDTVPNAIAEVKKLLRERKLESISDEHRKK
jgi:hypothetical protein